VVARPVPSHHLGNLVSVDFFVVPTVLFKVLFVFVVTRDPEDK
jgi:hypothetical protein